MCLQLFLDQIASSIGEQTSALLLKDQRSIGRIRLLFFVITSGSKNLSYVEAILIIEEMRVAEVIVMNVGKHVIILPVYQHITPQSSVPKGLE